MIFRNCLTYYSQYALKPNLELIGTSLDELFHSGESTDKGDLVRLKRSNKINHCLESLKDYTNLVNFAVKTNEEDSIFAVGKISDLITLTVINKYTTINSSLSYVRQVVLRNIKAFLSVDGLLKYLKSMKSILTDLNEEDKLKLLSPFKEEINEETLEEFLHKTLPREPIENNLDLLFMSPEQTSKLMREAAHIKLDLEMNAEHKFESLQGKAKSKLKDSFKKSSKTKNLNFDLKNISSTLNLKPSVVNHLLESDEIDEFFKRSIEFYLAPKKQKRGRKPKVEVATDETSSSITTNPLD